LSWYIFQVVDDAVNVSASIAMAMQSGAAPVMERGCGVVNNESS